MDGKERANMPLKKVDITGRLIEEFLHVNIEQNFINEGKEDGEFIYTFPLPDKASVCGFNARIGERAIKGKVCEKDKAYKQYEEAVRQGDSGYLLESFRENIFQVSLGAVAEGESVFIKIAYMEELKNVDNEMRLSIPTVVAPRFIPGKPSGIKSGMGNVPPTDRVPDADFITPPIDDVDYRASIKLIVDSAREIASIKSPSHKIEINKTSEGKTLVELADKETQMNGDFVLSVKVLEEVTPKYIYGKNEKGEYFAHITFAPELPPLQKTGGVDYIFLIDVSGSMEGIKLEEAKSAMKICLRNLSSEDRFNMAAFESSLHLFSKKSLNFSQSSLDKATRWIDKLSALGGTEILEAIEFALSRNDGEEREKVVMLFTDGEVGNEEEIIRFINKNNSNVRLYTMGIDTAVNSYFINAAAEAGNGFSEFAYPGDNIDDKVIRQFSRINASYMEELKLNIGDNKICDIAGRLPKRIYDMEPVSFIVKLSSKPCGSIQVRGFSAEEETIIEFDKAEEIHDGEVLEKLWAKRKLEELSKYLESANPRRRKSIEKEIVSLSEAYGVACSYTSFIAIYEREDKLSGMPEITVVSVAKPKQWDMFDDRLARPLASAGIVMSCFAAPPVKNKMSRMVNFLCQESHIDSSESYETPWTDDSLENIRVCEDKMFCDMAERKAISDIDVIKELAMKQNSDGSFGGNSDGLGVKLEETAKVLIQFITGCSSLNLYRNQLKKSILYIKSHEQTVLSNERLKLVVYIALGLCKLRKILKGNDEKLIDNFIGELGLELKDVEAVEEFDRLLKDRDMDNIKELTGRLIG